MTAVRTRGTVLAVSALLLGFGSGDGYRVGVPLFATLSSAQSLWALGAFLSGRWLAGGQRIRGAAAGAAFGALAITVYYAYQWLAYTTVAATSQLFSSAGAFFCIGAVGGGALVGVAGALTAASEPRRLLPAISWSLMAAILCSEAVFILAQRRSFTSYSIDGAAVVLVAIAAALLVMAVRECGWRVTGLAVTGVTLLAPVAAIAFFFAERRFGYLTL